MALQRKVKILSNRPVGRSYFRLKFACPQLARVAKPGQFIQAKIDESFEPLLRRPFGIHRVTSGNVEILYEVVGKGTRKLSLKKAGEVLDILGPLGNGFTIPTPYILNATPCILVAGGMGVAPLTFLAEKLKKSKILVLIGAKTKSQILCAKEFKGLGCEVKVATDDGSQGLKGYASELLKSILLHPTPYLPSRQAGTLHPAIFACGPKPMLKEIHRICLARNISCQASFEENIACGLGACLGCAIKTKSGFKRVCLDGPVFDIKEVLI